MIKKIMEDKRVWYWVILGFCFSFWYGTYQFFKWVAVYFRQIKFSAFLLFLLIPAGCIEAVDSQVMMVPARVAVYEGECNCKATFMFTIGNRNFVETFPVKSREGKELARHVHDSVMLRVGIFIMPDNKAYMMCTYGESYSRKAPLTMAEASDYIRKARFDQSTTSSPEEQQEQKKREMSRKILEETLTDEEKGVEVDTESWKD